jgi:hypothetical protein
MGAFFRDPALTDTVPDSFHGKPAKVASNYSLVFSYSKILVTSLVFRTFSVSLSKVIPSRVTRLPLGTSDCGRISSTASLPSEEAQRTMPCEGNPASLRSFKLQRIKTCPCMSSYLTKAYNPEAMDLTVLLPMSIFSQ